MVAAERSGAVGGGGREGKTRESVVWVQARLQATYLWGRSRKPAGGLLPEAGDPQASYMYISPTRNICTYQRCWEQATRRLPIYKYHRPAIYVHMRGAGDPRLICGVAPGSLRVVLCTTPTYIHIELTSSPHTRCSSIDAQRVACSRKHARRLLLCLCGVARGFGSASSSAAAGGV